MRPALSALAITAALILTVTAAPAEMDRAKLAAAQKAAADFVKLAGNSARTGKPPRQSDPKVDALLGTVFDTSAATSPEFSDLPRITQWLANADRVGLVYMLAGTGTRNLAAARNPKIADRIARNIAEFQDEYGRFVDFQIALAGFMLEAVRSKLDTASEKERANRKFQAGFVQVAGGIAQTVAGALSTFSTEGITGEWQRARLEPLDALAPKVADVLPKEMREKLGEMTLEIGDQVSDPQIKDRLKALAERIAK
ncbi:MAG: hypothetical protein AB7V13_22860 [Pseudorhodoplanes sp.]|uniref:hypothetical protein n=1 Tax=Pseudorhodoplanes sp. TaxID=1934341 RepID=UPI003D0AECB4